MKRGGGWTAGSLVRPVDVAADAAQQYAVADRRAAEALLQLRRFGSPSELWSVLAALEGNPRVFFRHRPDVPVAIREAELGLGCTQREDGTFLLAPTVDGLPVPDGWLSYRAIPERLILPMEEQGGLYLVRISPAAAHAVARLSPAGQDFPAEAADELAELARRTSTPPW